MENRRSVKSIHGPIGFCDLLARPVTSVPVESRFSRVTIAAGQSNESLWTLMGFRGERGAAQLLHRDVCTRVILICFKIYEACLFP